MDHAANYLVLIALGFPLAVYVWAALRTPREKVSTAANYFVAYRQVGTSPFADSSLAYAFQVATLFPFLFWGIQGQILPAIVNAICWGGGIAIFRWCLPSILRSLEQTEEPKTLHGLLGDAFSSGSVRYVAAWVTICGMVGMAIAEAYWGMQVLKVLVPEDTLGYYALVAGTLMFVLAYIWYGGTWGSMKTDMLQLVFSYIGFSIVFVYLGFTIWIYGWSPRPESAIVSACMLAGGALSVIARLRYKVMPISVMVPTKPAAAQSTTTEPDNGVWARLARLLSRFTFGAIVLMAACFAVLLVVSMRGASFAGLLNPGDPGWVGLAALVVMPLGFQFVDMSAWQRLQAISGTKDEVYVRARRGLFVFMVESPFSWILCLALGTLIITIMPQIGTVQDKAGPLAAFPRLLVESGSLGHIVIATLFMIAVMGVMLSTIDSVILAAMYAFVADVRKCKFVGNSGGTATGTEADGSSDAETRKRELADLLAGKKAAFLFIVVVCALLVILGAKLGKPEQLIGIMVGFYGGMLSLLPAVIAMLLGFRSWRGPAVAIGMGAGVAAAIGFTVWGIFDPNKAWYGVFAAPLLAVLLPSVLSPLFTRQEVSR